MDFSENTATAIGGYAPDFELPGIDDQVHHLAQYLEKFSAVAVIVMCNHCPYVQKYLGRLKEIQNEFASQGVILIGINGNDANQYPEDSFENMKVFAANHQLNLGASRTPEVFLLDKEGKLCYKGLIDDNQNDPEAVQIPYLSQAIRQLLNGEPVNPTITEAIGCSVKWRRYIDN
jgi:glutathione peroxidase-family protein